MVVTDISYEVIYIYDVDCIYAWDISLVNRFILNLNWIRCSKYIQTIQSPCVEVTCNYYATSYIETECPGFATGDPGTNSP